METLKEINSRLAFYKNSEFRWVRELYIEFESCFDEKLRPVLEIDFLENEKRKLFLILLDHLYRILSLNDYYWYKDYTESYQNYFHNERHPSNKTDKLFIKERVKILFDIILYPYYLFCLKIGKKNIDYYRLKSDKVELEKAKEQVDKMNELLKGEKEILLKVNYDRQESNRKEIGNMSKSYIKACETFMTEKPTQKMLNELSGISKDIWKKQFSNSAFLFVLLKEIDKKRNLAYKDKIPFWIGAYSYIEKKFSNALQDKKVKKTTYNDDVDYNRESGKNKKLNSDYD